MRNRKELNPKFYKTKESGALYDFKNNECFCFDTFSMGFC